MLPWPGAHGVRKTTKTCPMNVTCLLSDMRKQTGALDLKRARVQRRRQRWHMLKHRKRYAKGHTIT